VLILAGPSGLGEAEARNVDQYLMRGGALIVLDGRFRLSPMARGLEVEPVQSGLDGLLASWGITVTPKLVLDERNVTFPISVERDLGADQKTRDFVDLPYPFFPKVSGGDLRGGLMTSGLTSLVVPYGSPVVVEAAKPAAKEDAAKDAKDSTDAEAPRKVEVLARTTARAWLDDKLMVTPDPRLAGSGFPRPDKVPAGEGGPHALAVAITGGFPSWAAAQASAKDKPADPAAPRLLAHSPPDARLVVVGSSSFACDEVLQLADQLGAGDTGGLQLMQNLVDWAVADTDLLSIRARNSAAHALTLEDGAQTRWEWINYVIALLGLGLVVGGAALRRRMAAPFKLDPASPALATVAGTEDAS
jgi:ABC-2 type transport system permease protein